METQFLSYEEVIALHAHLAEVYGGKQALRDEALLRAALALPKATTDGRMLHSGPFEQAASYIYHLVQNQPFVEGNKRVAFAAALYFLELNGFFGHTETKADEIREFMDQVARYEHGKPAIARFVHKLFDPFAAEEEHRKRLEKDALDISSADLEDLEPITQAEARRFHEPSEPLLRGPTVMPRDQSKDPTSPDGSTVRMATEEQRSVAEPETV